MWILPLIGYVGLIGGFVFMVLAIASGLYYLSELVEEHTVLAKKTLTRLIYAVVAFQALLCIVDRFPVWLTLLSIGSHVVYLQNLRRFPVVKLTDPVFLASCVLVVANHYTWFRHFSKPPPFNNSYSPSSSSYPYRRWTETDPYYTHQYPTFTEIASFFGVCVWLVPFALFVSLSASENVLPSMGSEYATGEGSSSFVSPGSTAGKGEKKERAGLAKAVVDGVRGWVGEGGEVLGVWKANKRSSRF